MEHDGEDVTELQLEPVTVARTRRRRVLWGVLAVVAVAAGAVVIRAAGDDGPGRPGLPVALGAATERDQAAAADSIAWITYQAGDELPALGGEAAAYRLTGGVDDERVRALADALGVDGDVAHDETVWTVTGGAGTLQVYDEGSAPWTYAEGGSADAGGGSSGSTGGSCGGPAVDCVVPTTVAGVVPDCSERDGQGCGPVECAPDQPDCAVSSTDVPPAGCAEAADGAEPCKGVPAADLPSADEARAIALELLGRAGTATDGAVVTVDGPFDAWYVTVEPRLGGVPSGLLASVAVGPQGVITTASGHLATAEDLGPYATLDTRAVIERANAQVGEVGVLGPAEDAAASSGAATAGGPETTLPTTTVPPCEPQPDGSEICGKLVDPGFICPQEAPGEDPGAQAPTTPTCTPPTGGTDPTPVPLPPPAPEPLVVVLTAAEPILVPLPATDGTGDQYLVPGYRFTAADGTDRVDLPAVADEALAGPTTTDTTLPPESIVPDPGGTPPIDPQPCGDVLVEEDSSGTTHTVQPHPGCDPEPAVGVGYYVDVDLGCGNGSFVLGDRVWVSDGDEVASWAQEGERFEGGTFTLSDADHGTFVADAAATKTAEFHVLGPAEDIFCKPAVRE